MSSLQGIETIKESTSSATAPAACLDVDGTLIRTKTGGPFAKHRHDWCFAYDNVPQKLAELGRNGFRLILMTNQFQAFKLETIRHVMRHMKDKHGVRMDAYVAFAKQKKKPNIDMYREAFGGKRHPEGSFFVGDALGRKGDWSDSDRRFALACDLPIRTPEEVFLL